MKQQGSLFDRAEQIAAPSGERALLLDVHGVPVPQGSGKPVISKSTGRPFIKRDDGKLLPWRQDIGHSALAELAGRGLGGVLVRGPVRLVVRFRMPRRKSWGPKRTRLADVAVRPDFDKLVRAVADALTNVVYEDDGQITTAVIEKRPCAPGEPPGVELAVGPDFDESCE